MTKLNSKQIGNNAEDAAAKWLIAQGFLVTERNWQSHQECEIDIVAIKDGILFFVEVKYRKTSAWGDGLEYITDKKLKQMNLAAETYLQHNQKYEDSDWRLAALGLSGWPPKVTEFVEV